MLDNQHEVKRIISTAIKLFQNQGDYDITKLLKAADINTDIVHFDNWNGGTEYYSIYIDIDVTLYSYYENRLKEFEEKIMGKLEIFMCGVEHENLVDVIIRPAIKQYIDWTYVGDKTTKSDILNLLHRIKSILISVATGGPKIQSVNEEYKNIYNEINNILDSLKISNPNNFKDLWDWYERWSFGDLPTYQSRRQFISKLYRDVIELIEKSNDTVSIDQPYELTGWERVDRGISEIRKRIREAEIEEQFQSIGLLSRETIISLSQEVYDSQIHNPTDGVIPSSTDAKRMLDAYLNYELRGPSKETYRKYAKSALALANDLTHRRSASIHEASMCIIAVISLVNIVKVITNKSNIKF